MGKVKVLRKQQIIKSAGHYLCAENPEDLYDEYLRLVNASEEGNDDDLAADYAAVWEPLANSMTVAKLIQVIEDGIETPELPEVLKDVDWKLLREQKQSLLKVINDCDNVPVLEHLEGILVFLDNIMDSAVDEYGLAEVQVFGESEEEIEVNEE